MSYLVACTGTVGAQGPKDKSDELIAWKPGDTNYVDDDIISFYKSHSDVFTILDGPTIYSQPTLPSAAYINFNANGETNMTITIGGVVYTKSTVANAATGVWVGTTAATCATSLLAALVGDTRAALPFTAKADIAGTGVWIFWNTGGTIGNVTITTTSASACTVQNAAGGKGAVISKSIAIKHTVNVQELLSGSIDIPLPFSPLSYVVQVLSSGVIKAITDVISIQSSPTRLRIATTGATTTAAADVVSIIAQG